MRLQLAGFLAAVVLGAAACDDSGDGTTTPSTPAAGIRYVNAVPDTGALDFHAIDIVENSPYVATAFRDLKVGAYVRAEAGSRKFRVFPNSTNITATSKPLQDQTIELAANTNYTILHVGFARTGQAPAQTLIVRPDTIPTVPAGQIAFRVVHVGAGMGDVNVYTSADTSSAATGAAVLSNIAFRGVSRYVNVPVANVRTIQVTAAGSTATIASVAVPAGDPGTTSLDPIPGSRIAGSVFTIYVFPRSVAGSRAPQTAAFNSPGLAITPDVQLHARPTS